MYVVIWTISWPMMYDVHDLRRVQTKPCTNVTWPMACILSITPKWAQRYNTSHSRDLEWIGINILDAAPDLTVTQERSQMIHACLTGTAMEHQVTLEQESRQTWLQQEEKNLLHEVYVTKIDALDNLHATFGHMSYSRIETMILKGLWNGHSFDSSYWNNL